MNQTTTWSRGLVLALLLATGGLALAERPDWAGPGGKHRRDEDRREERRDDYRRDDHRYDNRDDRRYDGRAGQPAPLPQGDVRVGGYFGEAQRRAVYDHYQQHRGGGSCPPGLAKKNNGCMPPGQARQWTMGQPLPRNATTYPLDPEVMRRIGLPPAGYQYMRSDSDILLLNSSNVVVDVIRNLGRP